MTVTEAIEVRELLFDRPAFGKSEVEQIAAAIADDQCQEVRQYLTQLQELVEAGDDAPRNLLALGVTAYLMARHNSVIETLSRLPQDGLANFYHAQALVALEQFDDAAAMFQTAAQNGHNQIQCTLASAGAIRLAGRIDDAEKVLRASAREAATYAEYSYQMGCILADRGDSYGAIEYFERAADMDPHHSGALFRLAGQNNLMGNEDDAVRLYEQCLSKPPMFLGALVNLGLLYEDNENYAAAAFCFRRILEHYPNDERAQLYLKDIEASTNMYYDEDAARRDRELEQVLQTPITDFELSARSRNCLEDAGISTLRDLTVLTEQELLSGKNFGDTSLQEVRAILESRGLRIGQSIQHDQPSVPAFQLEDLSPEERAVVETPVSDLNLSVRASKCLSRLGIASIGELVSKSANELLSMRNFGVTSLNEIRGKLSDAGLALRGD